MPTLTRKKTITLNKLIDTKTRKPIVVKKPKGISDSALRSLRSAARSEGRQLRAALAA